MENQKENYPIFNSITYYDNLSIGINNLQTMHGVDVQVFRIEERVTNNFVVAYGTEKTKIKNEKMLKFIKNVYILSTPQNLYSQYIVGDENENITIYMKDSELLQGDIIRYNWVNGEILEFTISDLPKNFGGIYYEYKIKSLYQINQN